MKHWEFRFLTMFRKFNWFRIYFCRIDFGAFNKRKCGNLFGLDYDYKHNTLSFQLLYLPWVEINL